VKARYDLVETPTPMATAVNEGLSARWKLSFVLLKRKVRRKIECRTLLSDKSHDHRVAGGVGGLPDTEPQRQRPVVFEELSSDPLKTD
jgi:hypothetical protein